MEKIRQGILGGFSGKVGSVIGGIGNAQPNVKGEQGKPPLPFNHLTL